jgi:hypothetical protein
MALGGCLLRLVYIGLAVWIFFLGRRECALHYNGVAMLLFTLARTGRHHQEKGLVAVQDVDKRYGSGYC